MSKILDDVKSGLKGIRGAGDTVRGSLMEAADQTFEPNQRNPAVAARQEKHRAASEKGKQDIEGADAMLARHEWNRKDRAAQRQEAITATNTYQEPVVSDNAAPGIAAPGIAAPAVPPSQVAHETTAPATYETYDSRAAPGSRDPRPRDPRQGYLHEELPRN